MDAGRSEGKKAEEAGERMEPAEEREAGLGTVAVAVPLGGHPGGTARFLKKIKIVLL